MKAKKDWSGWKEWLGCCEACRGRGTVHVIDCGTVEKVPCGWCFGLGDRYLHPERRMRPADWQYRQTAQFRTPQVTPYRATLVSAAPRPKSPVRREGFTAEAAVRALRPAKN